MIFFGGGRSVAGARLRTTAAATLGLQCGQPLGHHGGPGRVGHQLGQHLGTLALRNSTLAWHRAVSRTTAEGFTEPPRAAVSSASTV
jgi:hypothetical protein